MVAFPSVLDRSRHDGVGDLYVHAFRRSELIPQPEQRSVDLEAFMSEVKDRLDGYKILCVVGDRYKSGEAIDSMQRVGIAAPFVARGVGYKDSTPDISAFQRYVDHGKIKHRESILMAHAIGSSYIMQDDALNQKLSKLKANKSKTDILQAGVLCIGQAARIEQAKPKRRRSEDTTLPRRRKYPAISPSLRRRYSSERSWHIVAKFVVKCHDAQLSGPCIIEIHHIVPVSVSQRGANEKSNLNLYLDQKMPFNCSAPQTMARLLPSFKVVDKIGENILRMLQHI